MNKKDLNLYICREECSSTKPLLQDEDSDSDWDSEMVHLTRLNAGH